MPMNSEKQTLSRLYDLISDSKQELFDRIASQRTNHLKIVLEDINKEHNASAVMRTCDCFGVQGLSVIEKNQEFSIHRDIAMGASKWVDIKPYSEGPNPTIDCIQDLKSSGYKVVATTPHTEQPIEDISIDQPIALVFGTERDGISNDIFENADELVKIPMYGFIESFNISVSAAIIMSSLRNRLEESKLQWKLSEEEQIALKIKWCTRIINNGEKVEQEIRNRIKKE